MYQISTIQILHWSSTSEGAGQLVTMELSLARLQAGAWKFQNQIGRHYMLYVDLLYGWAIVTSENHPEAVIGLAYQYRSTKNIVN